jgi:hypothetical protein
MGRGIESTTSIHASSHIGLVEALNQSFPSFESTISLTYKVLKVFMDDSMKLGLKRTI